MTAVYLQTLTAINTQTILIFIIQPNKSLHNINLWKVSHWHFKNKDLQVRHSQQFQRTDIKKHNNKQEFVSLLATRSELSGHASWKSALQSPGGPTQAVAPVQRPTLIYTESSSCPMRMMRLRQMTRQRMPDVIESLWGPCLHLRWLHTCRPHRSGNWWRETLALYCRSPTWTHRWKLIQRQHENISKDLDFQQWGCN